jgi:pimeloyl-ACP methyl ester carboxylesterase
LASSDSAKTHVLAFDYRGFGYSTGFPDENGLILDGIAAVNWAIDVANIPPERIVLVGQSLGTAVATAVAEHFVQHSKIEFAGLVLVAGFSDLSTLMLTYSAGTIFPVLSPLRPYPKIQKFFASSIKDTWTTANRLENWARMSTEMKLALIHAKNDLDISWTHCDKLFYAAANGTSEHGMTRDQIDSVKQHIDLGEGGWSNSWVAGTDDGGTKRITQMILRHGGKSTQATQEILI